VSIIIPAISHITTVGRPAPEQEDQIIKNVKMLIFNDSSGKKEQTAKAYFVRF
jgi:hypothetical protein